MVDKAKQDKGGCFAETCCAISTLLSRSSSSSFFSFFFMSSFTSVSYLSTELRPISNNIMMICVTFGGVDIFSITQLLVDFV